MYFQSNCSLEKNLCLVLSWQNSPIGMQIAAKTTSEIIKDLDRHFLINVYSRLMIIFDSFIRNYYEPLRVLIQLFILNLNQFELIKLYKYYNNLLCFYDSFHFSLWKYIIKKNYQHILQVYYKLIFAAILKQFHFILLIL